MAQMLIRDPQGGQALAPAAAGVVCGACNQGVSAGRFCSSCGTELKAKEEPAKTGPAFCSGCGSPLAPDGQFCGQCGRKR